MAKQKPEQGKNIITRQKQAANAKQGRKPAKKQMPQKKKPSGGSLAATKKDSSQLLVLSSLAFFALLLLAALFSGSMTLPVEKTCGLLGCIAVAVMVLFGAKRLGSRVGFLFLSVTAYVVWAMISTQYAHSGKFALSEATKLIVAYAFFLLVVLAAPKKFRVMKCVAYAIAALTAVIGILSVDAASSGLLSSEVFDSLSKYTAYYSAESAVFDGSRIGSFIRNSNIYGELMSLGVICSFWLAFNCKKWYERLFGALLIVINLYSDALAMSLVALFVCFIACLALALLSKRGEKLSYLLLMAESAVITLAALLVSYNKLGSESTLPMLCCIFGGVVLFGLDSAVRVPLSKVLKRTSNAISFAIFGALVVLVAGAAVAVSNSSAPYVITPESSLLKSIRLEPGEYEFSIEAENPEQANVRIESYNNAMPKIAEYSLLFSGTASDAIQVCVPDDSEFCNIYISAAGESGEQSISSISYNGHETGSIAPSVKYLPNFITRRLQSLSSSTTVYERLYLFKSSLALFAQNPVIGTGLGGYESGILSVQPFFLETKYAHNHYLQVLCDLGAIGLLLYLSVLIFSIRLLWKNRKDKKLAKYCPFIFALLIAMFGGALSDVCWSSGNYLPAAFTILGLDAVFMGDGCEKAFKNKKCGKTAAFATAVLFAVFGVAMSLNLAAADKIEDGVSFSDLSSAAKMDAFEKNDYLYSYVVNASSSADAGVADNALKYAERLSKEKSNTMGKGLAGFYFSKGMLDEGFKCINDYVDRNRSKSEAWQAAFDTLQGYFDPTVEASGVNLMMLSFIPDAAPRISALAEKMEQVGSEQLDTLVLNDETKFWLSRIGYISSEQITDTEALMDVLTSLVYDSRHTFDINEDGLPDPMYESTDDNGVTFMFFQKDISSLGEYSVDWYGKNGDCLTSAVWVVEAPDIYGTSIDKAPDEAPYLVIWKKTAEAAD